ncbi:MAG: HAMP domain-containing sensor histidine kinase [Pseudomonadota bacterium]
MSNVAIPSSGERFRKAFHLEAEKSFKLNQHHVKTLAFFSPALAVFAFFDSAVGESEFNTLPLRITAALLIVPIAIRKTRLSRVNPKVWPTYWIIACTLVFPFMFGLMLFINAALVSDSEKLNDFWMIQFLVATFLHVQLISRLWLVVPFWTVGTVLSLALTVCLFPEAAAALKSVSIYPISAFATAVFFGALFDRKSDLVDQEKFAVASRIGTNVAHELRTPLASIRNFANNSEANLPQVIEHYEQSVARGEVENPLTPRQLRALATNTGRILNEVEFSHTIIDMLMMSTSENPLGMDRTEYCSAADCVREAVRRFPFNNDFERQMTSADVEYDFRINAPPILVVHVLFNLIKNGIRFASGADEPRVLIRSSRQGNRDVLQVIDSGSGISKADQRRIFERFYTTQGLGQGAGIGLSFCRLAMETLGGGIECHSDGESFSEFRLLFPVLQEPSQINPQPAIG